MVETHKTEISFGSSGIIILSGIIGYFVYGQSVAGALGMILLAASLSILALISFIPIVGLPIYLYVGWEHLLPKVLDFAGLEPTWLSTGLFALYGIVGGIFWIVFPIIVLDRLENCT